MLQNIQMFLKIIYIVTQFTVSNSQDLASQLNITKPCVKNLLKDLLVEMRSFKYQITLQVSFRKEIEMMEQSIHHQFISILILKQ